MGIANVMTSWLRNENKIANRPMLDGRTPEQKAKDLEDILAWLRSPRQDQKRRLSRRLTNYYS